MKLIHKILESDVLPMTAGIIVLLLLASCASEPYYECYDNFRPEQVIIEGQEVTIYHKELVCNEYY